MMNLSIPTYQSQLHPRITVVGVGGAGGNAVNNMIRASLEGVEFVVANTDAQALAGNTAERKLQLGVGITQGLGAGSRPDVGRAAAEEAIEDIVAQLEHSHMVFITAGMGGGTGTGAAPVIARAAREQGILTVGVVTKPFHFEGAHRMKLAEEGLKELQNYVDTLIVIPNQNLFRIANEKTTFADAFKMADEVLHSGVRGVTDLMVMPGLINLDFADIRTVMAEMGKAMMGTGEAEGERRAVQAAEAAISNPLLDDVSMTGARGVLINITGGLDMTLYEVDEATNRIREEVDGDANIIFGSTFDERMEGRVRVSVVSTGIDVAADAAPRPNVTQLPLGQTRRPGHAASGANGDAATSAENPRAQAGYTRAAKFPPSVVRSGEAVARQMEPVQSEPEEMTEPEARFAADIAPDPEPQTYYHEAEHEASYEAPVPQPVARAPAPAMRAPAEERPAAAEPHRHEAAITDAKRRVGGLFRRVTGLMRDEQAPATEHEPTPRPQQRQTAEHQSWPISEAREHTAPPARPAAANPPRLTGIDTGGRPPLPRNDEEGLDIPAFLRRQAN